MAFSVKRIYCVLLIFSAIGIALFMRLLYLQGIIGNELATLGLFSRVQEVELDHDRGEIFDRNLKPLTNRNKQYDITLFPSQLKDKDACIQALTQYSTSYPVPLNTRVEEMVKPIKLMDNIPKNIAIEIKNQNLDGVVIHEAKNRYSDIASHIIGYCNLTDNRGMSGLEAMYDDQLKLGNQKYLAAFLDARSKLIPGLKYKQINLAKQAEKHDLVLTLDDSVQKVVEKVFDQHAQKGAAVVMDPHTGDILAMVSRPNFNAAQLDQYLTGGSGALLNRAISAYQPGSVFKLVVAIAALEKDLVDTDEKFIDKGYIDVDGTEFRRWDYKTGMRTITFQDAMAYSSNPIFIEVGLRIGMKGLVEYAEKLGFSDKTRLQFYNEMSGNLPSKDNIYRGELANLSIGQGECEVTPMQMAVLVSTIVNHGIQVNPVLVDYSINEDGEKFKIRKQSRAKRIFSLHTSEKIKKMMIAVNQYGTGQAAWIENGGSAGKTGSAETGRKSADGEGISHAWYVGFYPIDEPQYVVVVFVEDGLSGGDVAAPIFKEIIENIR